MCTGFLELVMVKTRFIKQVLAHIYAVTSITVNLLVNQKVSLVHQGKVQWKHLWEVPSWIQSKS